MHMEVALWNAESVPFTQNTFVSIFPLYTSPLNHSAIAAEQSPILDWLSSQVSSHFVRGALIDPL